MSIVERIRLKANEKGLTISEIEKATGISPKAIYRWDKSEPAISKVIAVANLLQVSLSWLATGKEESFHQYDDFIEKYDHLSSLDKEKILYFMEISLLDINKKRTTPYIYPKYEPYPSVVAEHAVPYGTSKELLAILGYVAAGKPIEGISVPMGYVTPPESINADYVLIAKGNSMDPVIKDGDHIFVKNCTSLHNGDIGVFYIDGDVTCKVYQPQENHLVLRSLNPDYEPFKFALTEQHDFKIQGKVILTKEQIARFSE